MSAAVSSRCPEPKGRFPRVTHPCAAPGRNPALDLHVLGAPPAFVLSQDQTLSFSPRPPKPRGDGHPAPNGITAQGRPKGVAPHGPLKGDRSGCHNRLPKPAPAPSGTSWHPTTARARTGPPAAAEPAAAEPAAAEPAVAATSVPADGVEVPAAE